MISPGKKIHFMGICGSAMAGVAVALKEQGYQVSGSDANVYPPMSVFLESKGIRLKSGYAPGNLSERPDWVVVGNAISRGNPELEEALDCRLNYRSLPETLREFFLRGRRNLVVSGTHGKTTTTSLLAWILESAGKQPSYMIGGIPKNLGQGARFRSSEFVVLEGDEYDTAFFDKRSKFLHYLPEIVIINNIEFDHADIYDDLEAIKLSFKRLIHIVPRNGLILANGDDPHVREAAAKSPAPVRFMGCDASNDLVIRDVHFSTDGSRFSFGEASFQLSLNGLFNVRNAAAAIAAARHLGISDAAIQKAAAAFEGVKRRQEVRAVIRGVTIIDDFGHHPTALRETLSALREKYPKARLWAFFEPRSNTTRRAVFQRELPAALGAADGVFVSRVARLDQLPEDDRLDPEKVMADIRAQGKEAYYLADTLQMATLAGRKLRSGDVAVIFSNGSFDGIHEKLAKALEEG